MNKKLSIYFIILFYFSCNSDKQFNVYYGNWEISNMYYKNNCLTFKKGDVINYNFSLGFEKNNTLWIEDLDTTKTIYSDFKFSKVNEQTILKIFKSDDFRINGIYKIQIDTIRINTESCLLKLTAKSDKVFFIARRNFSRY